MRKLDADKTTVILLVKGHLVDRAGYETATEYITKEVYGVKVMDKIMLCRYLREILFEARKYTTEGIENFHFDAMRRAFTWTKDFSWEEYINFHYAAIQGLQIRTSGGMTLIDLELSDEHKAKVRRILAND